MREMETLEAVEDAHVNLIERVGSYYLCALCRYDVECRCASQQICRG